MAYRGRTSVTLTGSAGRRDAGTCDDRPDEGRPRGRHTIFFGYAAGVGKTYSMLWDGIARAETGEDVVIGYLEPHVRPETWALAGDLEEVPPRPIDYHGGHFAEPDIEAIIARRPTLVLIDELAHADVPGEGHQKRWQNVDELLAAGIDVYSTLNVQHVESRMPAASQILGVLVRETVPDRVVEDADEVRLVDIDPDHLIDRAKQGCVYSADVLGRALTHVLRLTTLIALRELACGFVGERQAGGQ
jgi:two-component system sensor histidine kinase KdpD